MGTFWCIDMPDVTASYEKSFKMILTKNEKYLDQFTWVYFYKNKCDRERVTGSILWTVYKHDSVKNKKCLSVGNFVILSVTVIIVISVL